MHALLCMRTTDCQVLCGLFCSNGYSVLQPEVLQRILLLERSIRDWALSVQACTSVGDAHPPFCDPIDSALNYFFPSVVQDSGSNRTLRFDGLGFGANELLAQAGIRCATALSVADVNAIVLWLVDQGRGGFFSTGAAPPLATSAADASVRNATVQIAVSHLRTRFAVPKERWMRISNSDEGLVLLNLLHHAAQSRQINLYTDLSHCNPKLAGKQVDRWIVGDLTLFGAAFGAIFVFMWLYFGNVALALLAILQVSAPYFIHFPPFTACFYPALDRMSPTVCLMLSGRRAQIIISFPIMAFIVDVVLRQRPLSVFGCTSLFVVTGVSSDNIFVVHETWRQAYSLRMDGFLAPRAERVRWTLLQSARPLFIADMTTAFSLFINCFSPLPAIFQFGLCGGVLILVNFALVLIYMPSLLVLEELGCFKCLSCTRWVSLCCRCTSPAITSADTIAQSSGPLRSYLTHWAHDILFRFRYGVLVVFLALTIALFPAALEVRPIHAHRNSTSHADPCPILAMTNRCSIKGRARSLLSLAPLSSCLRHSSYGQGHTRPMRPIR